MNVKEMKRILDGFKGPEEELHVIIRSKDLDNGGRDYEIGAIEINEGYTEKSYVLEACVIETQRFPNEIK